MPTPTGGETIAERLVRLRTDLARVRLTVQRHENNGAQWAMGGTTVTEIAYERAQARAREIESEIAALESRLSGSAARPGLAQIQVKFD